MAVIHGRFIETSYSEAIIYLNVLSYSFDTEFCPWPNEPAEEQGSMAALSSSQAPFNLNRREKGAHDEQNAVASLQTCSALVGTIALPIWDHCANV